MSDAWVVVIAVGAFTVAFKAAAPVALGGRELPPRIAGPLGLLAPSLLAALVVTQTVGADRALEIDARAVGVAAAAVAVWRRAPLLLVMVAAAVAAALARGLA